MIKYIGLDFEASGSDPWAKHVPIQLGMTDGKSEFRRYISGWDWKEWEWDPEAFEVHGISQQDLQQTGMPMHQVDVEAAYFLYRNGWKNRMFTVPVGFNVAGYDRQFITRWMPNLDRLLSYRSVDLNALIFARAGESEKRYIHYKKNLKTEAEERITERRGYAVEHHDALDDASLALEAFHVYREWNGIRDD